MTVEARKTSCYLFQVLNALVRNYCYLSIIKEQNHIFSVYSLSWVGTIDSISLLNLFHLAYSLFLNATSVV